MTDSPNTAFPTNDPPDVAGTSSIKGKDVVQPGAPINKPKPSEAPLPPPIIQTQTQSKAASVLAVQPEVVGQTPSTSPAKKSGFRFPKKLLILPVILLLIAIIGLVVTRLMPSGGGPSVGTKGQIIWWGISFDESELVPLIQEYEARNPGIEISYVKQSDQDYRQRLANALAGPDGPDIFEIHNTWVPMFKEDLDKLPGSVMGGEEFEQTFYPVAVSDLKKDNNVYALPLFYDAITLYINEDIFSSAAKQPPIIWSDLQDLVDPKKGAMTIRDERGLIIRSGVALGNTANVEYWPEIIGLMFYQNGANHINPSEKTGADAINFYNKFKTVFKAWDQTLPPSTDAFAKGKVAMMFAPSVAAREIVNTNSLLRFKTVNLPQLPKDSPDEPDISYANYWAEAVSKRSVNKGEAWKFLRFLIERESLRKLFENSKNKNSVGRPYPRQDMRAFLAEDDILGSVVALAPNARSWYLASKTNDGGAGINSQINALYKEAIDATKDSDLKSIPGMISKTLGEFGIRLR